MERILITSALPYANGPLHFGHIAGAYLPGDCYARFQRLQQNEVLYLCGSDEYGVAITLSAEMAGKTPQEHVDHYHEINKALFEKMEFSFDHYSRTTWPGHTKVVQELFIDLWKKGYIEEREEMQLFSEKENRFLADRYVLGICPKCGYESARGDECVKCGASYEAIDLKNPRSKLTDTPLVLKKTEHLYLRFDKFKEKLLFWIQGKKWKPNVMQFAKHYIEELKPRAITRDLQWGIPVPLPRFKGKVFYVWFDAPIGYISAAKEWGEKIKRPEDWKKFWLDSDTKLVQFIGKDNIPFHAVFFPATLMGVNEGREEPFVLVDELPANEFLNLEGRQFSKSEGWYIDLEDFFCKYSPDQIRYYLAAGAPEHGDSEFSWKEFQIRCNSELLAKYGNFVNRTLVFLTKECGGKTPRYELPTSSEDKDFLHAITAVVNEAYLAYANFSLRKAASLIMELAAVGNSYFDLQKPWVLAKDPGTKKELARIFANLLECIKTLALISSPIIPMTAQTVWEQLGNTSQLAKESWKCILTTPIPAGQVVKPQLLFKKIEDEEVEKEIAKFSPKNPVANPGDSVVSTLKSEITFDQFQTLDLRVATILSATSIPKSKRLLLIELDLGFEKRKVVSGIAEYYNPQELIGKKVIFVANLKPTKIMGVESRGMILAASFDKEVELPFLQNVQPGSIIS